MVQADSVDKSEEEGSHDLKQGIRMKLQFGASVALLLAGVPLALAQAPSCGGCVPGMPQAPITIMSQPPAPPPMYVPPKVTAGPVFFERVPTAPIMAEGKPKEPITLFHREPCPVHLQSRIVPPVILYQKEAQPPLHANLPPRNPITLFTTTQQPGQFLPQTQMPPVTIYSQPPQMPPVYLGTMPCSVSVNPPH